MPRERLVVEPQKSELPSLDPEERRRRHGFASVVGQGSTVEKLRALAALHAAHGRLPGHILLVGADGMGKRSLARAFAAELGSKVAETEADGVDRPADLMGILVSLGDGDIWIVSNIGSLRKSVRDLLLQAITEFKVDIVLDKGMYARTLNYTLRAFTLIATCRTERDCPPELSDGFLPPARLEPYSHAELVRICGRIAESKNISITAAAAAMVVSQSRGSPRQTEILLQRLVAAGKNNIDEAFASQMLSVFGLPAPGQGTSASVGQFDALSGVEFERLVTGLLERMGFRTEMTKASGDGGVDIVATLDRPIVGGRYIIQCKRYAPDSLVGAALVREFYGALTADRRALKGVLITTSGFTTQALDFARELHIELIGCDQLWQLLADYGITTGDSPPPLFAQ